MLALVQFGNFAMFAVVMLVRSIVAKWNSSPDGSGVWVTSRTGNVTVVTDKLF